MDKRKPSYIVVGKVNACNHYGEQYGGSLRKLKIGLPYDPSNQDKTLIEKNTSTLMFIAALFTIAKIWKQPRCPSTKEWIKKIWYMYRQHNTPQP